MPLRQFRNAIAVGLILSGCADTQFEPPEPYRSSPQDRIRERYGTIHGDQEGFVLFSTRPDREDGGSGGAAPGIGVNAYLWRAALETIDFLPLAQADPFGGVIITEWYSPPETPSERFKLNVYILDTVLRADGIKVAVFRQVNGEGGWRDAEAGAKTATDIEDQILTRARELRIAATEASS
jgi:hypothetical protein